MSQENRLPEGWCWTSVQALNIAIHNKSQTETKFYVSRTLTV
jgi:hypothetical protein